MNRKFLIIAGILVVAVLIVVGGSLLQPVIEPNLPKGPTPIPTQVACVHVTGLGGPMLDNKEIRAILAEPWTDRNGENLPPVCPDTKYANTSSSSMNTWGADPKNNKPADYTGIDFVWAGDTFYAEQFKSMNPSFRSVPTHSLFYTKLGGYSWFRHIKAYMDAGYVEKIDNYFYMPEDKAAKLLRLQDEGKTYRDAGIIFDDDRFTDSLIDINGSAYGSSTGIEQMAWMANCFANDCKAPTTEDQVNLVLPHLIKYVRQQGLQGTSSLRSFDDFLTNGEGNVMFVGYDSAFATVASEKGWTPEQIRCISSEVGKNDRDANGNLICRESNRIVFIYFGGGTTATHTLMPLTENGRLLVKRLADPRIQEIAWVNLGQTTAAVFTKDTAVEWMSPTVPTGNKPSYPVYTGLISGLDAEFKR